MLNEKKFFVLILFNQKDSLFSEKCRTFAVGLPGRRQDTSDSQHARIQLRQKKSLPFWSKLKIIINIEE